MEAQGRPTGFRRWRLVIIGVIVMIVVAGLALVIQAIGHAGQTQLAGQVDALANSNDACVTCHRETDPGIVQQFGHSTMAAAKVTCRDCHEVQSNYPTAIEHEGTYIISSPTPARCQRCHQVEVAQYYQSRHSLPAYVAFAGSKNLSPALMQMYQAIPEGDFSPDKTPNSLAVLNGPIITQFACQNCHSIGKPNADGSVGECQKCHLRHAFSLEQARKPETCSNCHIGPDHPQWEIYQESPHGVAYASSGETWNWDAAPGTLTTADFPAPTCAICHMSGFGATGTTHDVGDRLTWYLFASVSQQRPAWQDNRVRMQSVCLECHNKQFVTDFYTEADKTTGVVNDWVNEGNAIMNQLQAKNLLTAAPFDEPIDFTSFELWHHYGRTAKFGVWMNGPDYTQWHGAYEILSSLADLREMAQQKLQTISGQ